MRVAEEDRLAAVDEVEHSRVGGDLEADREAQRAFDLAALERCLRVRPVQDEADAVSGERKQVERVQTEGRVLRRQRVDAADEQKLVAAVEGREQRSVEEGRRVDDDVVVGVAFARSCSSSRACAGARASAR